MTTKKFSISQSDIYRSSLSQIIERLVRIKTLESLCINFCDLQTLPDIISDLSHVKFLSLRGNYLTEIPLAVLKMKSLAYLDIAFNKVVDIPHDLKRLKEVINLDISNNLLTEIPDEIEQLIKLENLKIHDNKVAKISSKIGNLKNLKYMSVDFDVRIVSRLKLLPKSTKIEMFTET
jgi:Leucine-rich repeat (LRR) protein